MTSLSKLAQREIQVDPRKVRGDGNASHRRRPLRVLFVHRDAEAVGHCVEELETAQFTVHADTVLSLTACTEPPFSTQSYDAVVAEYPAPSWSEPEALQLFLQKLGEIPMILLTATGGGSSITELTACGAFDFVERDHITQLPMAIRRALNERDLRVELNEARKALRHSQSLYRALVDNPSYGIGRCDAEGKFLRVNQALVTMLGYDTAEELLMANRPGELISDVLGAAVLPGGSRGSVQFEAVEAEWRRKNGTILKVRISGRSVYDERGEFVAHEFIVVDTTEQRTLEDQLRHQASSDSLTGLANHRRLFEVLHAEICRSDRTGREFSLLMLDLDGLKEINDQHGHQAGDRALCKLARILGDCSRSIDTAARQGGDEFALVLPETGTAAAELVGRRICNLVADDAEEPSLSVSVGIASFPSDARTIGELIYAADRALYAMKGQRPRTARAKAMAAANNAGARPF